MSELTSFADLGLSAQTIAAIEAKGFEEPTKIQSACIPLLLKDQVDVIGQAQTGTGKTAAFGLPILEIVDPSMYQVQALILAPTRELAVQNAEEINSLKGDRRLEIAAVYGGASMELQLRKLKRGVHVVVGTPGRILTISDVVRCILSTSNSWCLMKRTKCSTWASSMISRKY